MIKSSENQNPKLHKFQSNEFVIDFLIYFQSSYGIARRISGEFYKLKIIGIFQIGNV